MTQTVPPAHPVPGGDDFRLDGCVALVAGAGRGIGAGIAQAYALAGADVALVARSAAELEKVAVAVRALGRSALVVPTDLTEVSRAGELVERTVTEYGRLDILVTTPEGRSPAHTLTRRPRRLTRPSTSTLPHRSNSSRGRPTRCSRAAKAR
jgi:short-subunit dehydrogenase involved in D-alanine esterification of teichoic acids